jgi:hypothetical protein
MKRPILAASDVESAARGPFCLTHAGVRTMAEHGRRGGQQSVRSRLGVSERVANEKLRGQQAKRALEEALSSDNEQVPSNCDKPLLLRCSLGRVAQRGSRARDVPADRDAAVAD